MTATIDQPAPADEEAPAKHRRDARLEPLSKVALVGVAFGALSQWTAAPALVRFGLLLAFVFCAPGSATVLWWQRLSRTSQYALAPVLGISMVVLSTVSEAFARYWHPVGTLTLLAAATVASVVVRTALTNGPSRRIERPDGRPPVSPRRQLRRAVTSGSTGRFTVPALLLLATISWALCLPSIGSSGTSQWGLLVSGGPWFFASIVLCGIAGMVAFARRSPLSLLTVAFAFVVVERFTIAIAAPSALYPWTAKHEAVVDFIDRYHDVVRGTDIYHNWPGMFTTMAWAHQLTGVSVAGMAHWFTPIYHLVLIPLMYAAVRAWGRPPPIAAGAACVFEACSFAAQDYFSPQALGYLLAIGVLILLGESRERRTASTLAILVFSAITITHQLTPYWLILVAAALVVLRRLRSWWLPVVFAGIAGGYLVLNYAAVKQYGVTSSANPIQNARLSGHALPLFGIRTQFYAIEAVYALLFGSAGIVLAWRLFRTKREWRAPAALAFAPVLLLLGQGYGGEAIFRVFLYALPGLSVVASTLVLAALARARWSALTAALVVPVTVLLAAHAFLGSYSAYRVTPSETAVWQAFNHNAPGRAYFLTLGPGFIGNPEWYYVGRTQKLAGYARDFFSADTKVRSDFASNGQYEDFMSLVVSTQLQTVTKDSPTAPPLFFALSDAEQDYAYLYGVLPKDATRNLRRHMLDDPRWTLIENAGTSQLFRYKGTQ